MNQDKKHSHMEPRATATDERKEGMSVLKSKILEVLGWSEVEFMDFQIDMGMEFLEHYISEREHQLSRSHIFWNWWRSQWAIRDESLLCNKWDLMGYELSLALYKDVHCGSFLATEIYPTKTILDQSYMDMITEFTHEELHKYSPS